MSEEKKARGETRCGPFQDPALMKKFQAMFDEGEGDCAQMMSRIRAMCCGPPEGSEEQDESVKEKKTS